MTHLARLELDLLSTVSKLNLRPTLDAAAEAGRILSEARPLLPHGDWIPWLRRVGLSRQTASDYIQVYTQMDAGIGNVRPAGRMTIKQFLVEMRRASRAALKEHRLSKLGELPESEDDGGVIHGDGLAWLRSRPDGSVPFVVTDPPFGVGLSYDGFTEPGTPQTYIEWFSPYWREMVRVMSPGGQLVVLQSRRYHRHLWDWYGEDIIVTPVAWVLDGQSVWRPAVRWVKPGRGLVKVQDGEFVMVPHDAPADHDYKAVHPCPMPVGMARLLVQRFTREGSVVVDPFAGTGAIGVACHELGRTYVGIDQSAAYVAVARHRMAGAARVV